MCQHEGYYIGQTEQGVYWNCYKCGTTGLTLSDKWKLKIWAKKSKARRLIGAVGAMLLSFGLGLEVNLHEFENRIVEERSEEIDERKKKKGKVA